MLTRKEKRFIKKLIRYAKRNNNIFEISVPKDRVDNFLKEINFKISHNELALLNAKGYFYEYTAHNNRTDADMFSGVFFCLSYNCLHYKEIEARKFLDYLKEKWIDFLAMITSMAALILSLISLLSQ